MRASAGPGEYRVLDSRRFTAEELIRIFHGPPLLVGIRYHSSFMNAEVAERWSVTFTLVRMIVGEFNRALRHP